MTHYYVTYNLKNLNDSGFGSIEVSIKDDVFVPSDISDMIAKNYGLKGVIIMNWKVLETNQLCTN